MSSDIKQLSLDLLSKCVDWVRQPITHVALPALLLALHTFATPLWETDLAAPITYWSFIALGLVVWLSAGLIVFLDIEHYFEEGPLADFFGFTDSIDEDEEL